MQLKLKLFLQRMALVISATRWFLLFVFFIGYSYSEFASKYSFLKQATEAPTVSYYDYIIVGGGTAGCPLAATLSKNFTVLLLERGGSPYGNNNISNIPFFFDTLSDNSPTSPSQRFVSEDGVINARARVLGGGSCINAGFYSRASSDYIRRAGWNAQLANDSYRWVERLVAFRPRVLQWQSAMRDGLLEAGVTPYNGFTYDHIEGTKVGGTIFDLEGNRHTAADLLQRADPARLTVLLRASAATIVWKDEVRRDRAVASGVVYKDEKGRRKWAYLKDAGRGGEVIVTAGAMGSPQILMLSGVGPREGLERLGIKVVVEQPMVGQGMADNPMNSVYVPSPTPVEVSLVQVVAITRSGTYIEGISGGFHRALNSQTGNLSTLPPKQRTYEAIAHAFKVMNAINISTVHDTLIVEKVIGPLSTGHLELKTRNPDDNPSVTFNYFKDPVDLQRCVDGMKIIERVIKSKSFAKFRYANISMEELLRIMASIPTNLRPRHANVSRSLEQYCRDTVHTIWHYHGGCQVGRVVDRDYRVIGVDALRVIDGSTFKSSPGTNPQATVMMLGRYMGVKILNERLRTKKED